MNSTRRASKAAKSTINYHRFSLDEHHLFEPDALITKERDANHQSRQSSQSCRTYAYRRLTTPQFVSALSGIWNLVGQPESSGTAQRSSIHGISSREDPVCFSRDQQGNILTPCCVENSSGLRSQYCFSTPKEIYEDLIYVKKKMLTLTPFNNIVGASSTWMHMHSTNKVEGAHYLQFGTIYSVQAEKMEKIETSQNSKRSMCEETCASSNNMDIRDNSYSNQTRHMPNELFTISNEEASSTHDCESSRHNTECNLEKNQEDSNFLACPVHEMEIAKEVRIMPGSQVFSKACTDAQLDKSKHMSCLVGDAVVLNSANADESACREDVCLQLSLDKCSQELQPTFQHRFDGAVTINRHAVAGALAGTAVSVSLHPIDTVKTIIQANSYGQSSVYHTLRRTLIERGVLGLYGGLASKLACSAPISAIYTLTYETVKGALLPVFPKFYAYESLKQSLLKSAPDRAKLNSGQTLTRVTYYSCGKEHHATIPSFFFTLLTLSTYFQVQHCDFSYTSRIHISQCSYSKPIPYISHLIVQALSPVCKYDGVVHALKEIFRHEGLCGLYRGLTPRLAMYMSQGAIFFTSYEFLSTLMFPEPEQEVHARSV
ncbi:Mitochondrial substrate carrier family protein [Zea mays]|uniref:Mitochondrial substrate carrier family protein n=1 Tax=Zea mays TaxID=4577 RepID=A0A1D6Q6K1_MAIZE|nr:Mitochondrial substrate carrier family protein [Zea mays]